jgi:hypothetical protein
MERVLRHLCRAAVLWCAMPSISYPTRYSEPGPWLFDPESLEKLDRLIDSSFESMRERRQIAIQADLSRQRESLLGSGYTGESVGALSDELKQQTERKFAESRKLTIFLKDLGTVEGESFTELAGAARTHEQIPLAFSLKARSGPTRIDVILWGLGDSKLDIAVSSDDDLFAEELFGRLRHWAWDIQPSKRLQLWINGTNFGGLLIYLLCLIFVFTLAIIAAPSPGPSLVRQQAREIAKQGVTQANETKAIELLLSMVSGYEPTPTPSVQRFPGLRFYAYFAAAFFVVIAFKNPPHGAIGLWAGKRLVERQRKWIAFVTVSAPGFVISSAILPLITHALGWSK